MKPESPDENQPIQTPLQKGRLDKTLKKVSKIRPQKLHLDYIAGLLTIPVLVTAILLNFNNISGKKDTDTPTPTPKVIILPQATAVPNGNTNPNVVTAAPVCKKAIGPVTIDYPEEGDTISDNPLSISISYSDENYCSVVWSYRINDGPWSSYNNTSPSLYNLPSGSVRFQLRVNSTVSSETKTYTRNFNYIGGPTPTQTASSSATTN